jgi:two-component sensor histidine kinase
MRQSPTQRLQLDAVIPTEASASIPRESDDLIVSIGFLAGRMTALSQVHPVASPGHEVTGTSAQSAESGKRLSRTRLTILIFLGWTGFGLFMAAPEVLISPAPWVFVDKLFDSWVWALLTPGLILVDRRFAARQTSGIHLVRLLVLLSIPVVLVHTYLTAAFLYPIAKVWWSPFRSPEYAVYYFLGGLGTYGALVGILQALRFHHRYLTGRLQLERVEKSLIESRLNALRLHLEPHFLFNTLNAISSEVADNPQLAREMIGDLGALLRRSLDSKGSVEITLAQELALLDHYLSIQRVRFGDRIDIEVDVEPVVLSAMVPSMLLQPLVENAIRHGIERRVSGGRVAVSARKVADQLRIEVTDDGVGLPARWRMETSKGHGVRVTRERLVALYAEAGDDCLNIRRREGGGTEAVICIPLRVRNWDDSVR